ncbi:hypothetical protein Tco_0794363 [Tanacetum coccineum]
MVDMVNQRKKHFAEERAKAKRNKPMTQSQLRIYMSNYLKNQGTWKLSQLNKLSFEEIKEEFDKLTKTSKKQKIDDKDVPAIGEKVAEVKEEEPVKRTGKRKKQKARKGISVDKNAQGDSETDKEESVEAMNPTPLATKSNIVVNWKIFQQGQRSIYQIIRANRADTVYMSFGAMVKDLTKEDLIELYMMVMQKYGTNRPKDSYDRVLWSDLRTMFDPPLNEDAIWSLPLQQKMINWRSVCTARPSINTARPVSTVRPTYITQEGFKKYDAEWDKSRVNRVKGQSSDLVMYPAGWLVVALASMYWQTKSISDYEGFQWRPLGFWEVIPKEKASTRKRTEFKNYAMNEFCAKKGIKREFNSMGKFDGKSDEGYLLRYSTSSKAFRVYNKRTKRVEENLHINFLEDQPNVTGTGPNWMFSKGKIIGPTQEYILLPLQLHRTRIPVKDVVQDCTRNSLLQMPPSGQGDLQDELEMMVTQELGAKPMDDVSRHAFKEEKRRITSQKKAAQATNHLFSTDGLTHHVIDASTSTGYANAVESSFVYLGTSINKLSTSRSSVSTATTPYVSAASTSTDVSDAFSRDGIFNGAYDDKNVGAVADFNNMDDTIIFSPIPTLRIHKNHPKD